MVSPLDLSHTDIARKIQTNLIAYMNLFADQAGVTIVDADEYWIITHKPAPGNSILRATWQPDEAESRIDDLFDQVGHHVDELDWLVFPHDQPTDLGKRLEARGMKGGPGGNWLWMDVRTLGTAPAVSENFHIERVRDDAMLVTWTRLSEVGFGSVELSNFYDAYARHGYGADASSIHYIGYLDDTPVTSGTLLDAGGAASIYDLSTPPSYRGQGFGGALTHALLRETRDRGYTDTWIWSSNMAKNLYRELGFVDADFGVREHTWRKGKY
jgi:ribosomal protein S18 acetylase RimI-like enzyme